MIKKINYLLIFITLVGSIICLFISNNNIVDILKILSIFLSINVINILKLKIKIDDRVNLVYILFIIAAHFLGVIINLYDKIACYDKIVHFSSGIVTAVVGSVLIKEDNKLYKSVRIIILALAVAAMWEIFEYTSSIIFNIDPQKNVLTGVNDTMQDIIVAFLGSILYSLICYINNFDIK